MATNPRIRDFAGSTSVAIVATATITMGQVGWFSGYFGRADAAAVSGDTITIQTEGVFQLPKPTATAYAVGDELGWDATNNRVIAGSYGGRIGRVFKAAASNDTTVLVKLEPGPRVYRAKYVVTAGDDTANSATIDTGFGAVPAGAVHVQIKSTGNVYRVPQGAVALLTAGNAGKITVADTGLAVNEEIHITVAA